MANKSGGKTTYFVIGAALAALIAVIFFLVQEQNEPELEISVGDDGIAVDTN